MRSLTVGGIALAALSSIVASGMPAQADVAETLTATFPTGTHRVGANLQITGEIAGQTAGAPSREVDVQVHGSNGTWVTTATATTKPDATFAVPAPSWWVARQTMRVYAPATDTEAAVASTRTGTMTIKRSYTPRGGTAFAYLFGHRYRWNPCQVIDYRINPKHLPRGGRGLVRWAFQQVSQATGLRFRYAGTSGFVPFEHPRSLTFPANADFVVAWSTPRIVHGLAGSTVGLGGAQESFGSGVDAHLSNGGVVFDSTQRLGPTPTIRASRAKELALHEFGHALGLGHVTDRRQIMYPSLQAHASRYAAGDLRGLARLGAGGGCLNVGGPARSSLASSPLVVRAARVGG